MPFVDLDDRPVLLDTLRVIFGSVGPDQFRVYRNGVDVTPQTEWAATWSEVMGVGEASIPVQNRAGVDELDWHNPSGATTRDIIKMTYGPGDETDWVLFEGEAVSADLDLSVGFPWRRWIVKCTDWNTVPDLRLMNVPDGQNWLVAAGGDADLSSSDPNGPRVIDPDAIPGSTDKATIQNWYDAKVRLPDGGALDTDTFIGEYVPNSILNDATTGEPNYVPGRGSVKSAISGLSALAAVPVSDWIDPDRKVHHVSFDVPDMDLMPPCPVEITDIGDDWDGTTKIGGRGLSLSANRGNGPEEAYIEGNTDYLRLATDDPDVGVFGPGRDLHQGTGWGHSDPSTAAHTKSKRQTLFSGQAVTATERDALADTVTSWKNRPRIMGRITTGGRDDEGDGLPIITGFRVGQRLTITDQRLPDDLNGVAWPLQGIRGSLVAGRGGPGQPDKPSILQYTFEFGDAPQGQFSAQLAAHERAKAGQGVKPKPAPKHVISSQFPSTKPGQVQTLTAQARGNDDLPVAVKGVPVHWRFGVNDAVPGVTDHLGADRSGNGESLDPTDTFTDENGRSTTVFTAGSLDDTYYLVVAETEYQP